MTSSYPDLSPPNILQLYLWNFLQLPAFRDSDLGPHMRPPPTEYGACLRCCFNGVRVQRFLPSSTRVKLCMLVRPYFWLAGVGHVDTFRVFDGSVSTTSRVESGRVGVFEVSRAWLGSARLCSAQEGYKTHRLGRPRLTRPDPTRPDPTRPEAREVTQSVKTPGYSAVRTFSEDNWWASPHPFTRSHAGLGRMQLTLHVTRRTLHCATRLLQAVTARFVKIRRAPSRHCRGVGVLRPCMLMGASSRALA